MHEPVLVKLPSQAIVQPVENMVLFNDVFFVILACDNDGFLNICCKIKIPEDDIHGALEYDTGRSYAKGQDQSIRWHNG